MLVVRQIEIPAFSNQRKNRKADVNSGAISRPEDEPLKYFRARFCSDRSFDLPRMPT